MKCNYCNKPFEALRKTKKYCSDACRARAAEQRKYRTYDSPYRTNDKNSLNLKDALEAVNWYVKNDLSKLQTDIGSVLALIYGQEDSVRYDNDAQMFILD